MIRTLTLLLCNVAVACPLIGSVPDYNCDGEVNLVILGDSIVYGTGDTVYGGKGGWVLRAKKKLPEIRVFGFGIPGDRTHRLLSRLEDTLRGKDFRYHPYLGNLNSRKVRSAILKADYVILYIGVNNFWELQAPSKAINDLTAIRNLINNRTRRLVKMPPLVITSRLWVPNRSGQGSWVRNFDAQLRTINSLTNPTDLPFDLLSGTLLNSDNLHPSSAGYDAMYRQLKRYLHHSLPSKVKKIHGDKDSDGVYDKFETLKFGTDPKLYDTDGDGFSDSEEIFILKTDPLDPNSPTPIS